jgi:4-hydroxybenzoate polyprenyltransferase
MIIGVLELSILFIGSYIYYSLRLGLSSLGLVVLYPAMKRVTNWPQAVLGMLPMFQDHGFY